jgi:chromosome segregation ATPase
LRLRDEIQDARASLPRTTESAGDAASTRRIEGLTAELAERDRTIELLWAEITAIEESRAADRAEWDQLAQIVEQLEASFEADQLGHLPDHHASEAATKEVSRLRSELESERASALLMQRQLEQENAALRQRVASHVSEQRDGSSRQERVEERVHEAELVLSELREQLVQAQRQLETERLDHARERMSVQAANDAAEPEALPDVSPNARIHALRQHLREVHEREVEERRQQQLSARLSRLWQRISTPH